MATLYLRDVLRVGGWSGAVSLSVVVVGSVVVVMSFSVVVVVVVVRSVAVASSSVDGVVSCRTINSVGPKV